MSDLELVKEVMKDFSKEELLGISKELELGLRINTMARDIIQSVLDDLDENGVPEDEDCSDLLYDFLVATGYVEDDEEDMEGEYAKGGNEGEIDEPECFGWADKRDPACKKCSWLASCVKERVETRPECFGLLFDTTDPECGVCIEASSCSKTDSKER